MNFLKNLLAIILLTLSALEAKPPELTAQSTKEKIHEILVAHSTYKQLTDDVVERLTKNFIEELDPLKCYFLEHEVESWISPTPKFLDFVRSSINSGDYQIFNHVLSTMEEAVKRREQIESWLKTVTDFPVVEQSALKDLPFAKTPEELKDKLLKIRSLQLKAAQKLSKSELDLFLKRLERNLQKKKNDIFGTSPQEQTKNLYANVIKALASALDNHTVYFTPQEANAFIIQVQQRLFGIGAHLRDDFDGLNIIRLMEGGPASLSKKIKIGDKIVAVNHEPIIGMDMVDAVEMIRGPQGTKVLLTLIRTENNTENSFDIEITRDEIVLKESRFETSSEPCGDGIIGRIHLYSFYQDPTSSSYQDLKNAILEFKKQNLKGLVLDLRNNGGGLLPQAVEVASLFLGKGVIASIKDSSGHIQHLRNLKDLKVYDGPLAVLINRASASASEIVAQTLQDYGRAIIVGDDHSFGKGTYQTFTMNSSENFNQVNPSGEYKVTRGMYYTVSGKTPQLEGTISDIEIPGILSKVEIGEKFSKNPLTPDQIKANFEDDLSDIHPLYRFKVRKIYAKDQERPSKKLHSLIPTLRENSKTRITANGLYQEFLKKAEKFENLTEEELEDPKHDYQLQETYNVMKELIYLTKHGKLPTE
jgi:carboxyl-terminal processing protease